MRRRGKSAPRVAAPSGCLRQGDMRPYLTLIEPCAVLACLTSCGHGRGNRARLSGRAASLSTRPLGVYIYAVGPRSCRIRRAQKGSARLRPRPWPHMAPSGAGPRRRMLVAPSGEKLDSSRALHPPSAARYFVGGIPPSRLARVRWRITRTVVAPFPCAHSLHMRR